METKFLLPYGWKKIGWILLIPFVIIGLLFLYFGDDMNLSMLNYQKEGNLLFEDDNFLFTLKNNNFTDEIIAIGLLLGLIISAFSKEKIEDEWSAKIRLESLLWAVYLNTFLLFLSIILLYGNWFWQVMILNLFTPLIFFLVRFRYVMAQSTKESTNDMAA